MTGLEGGRAVILTISPHAVNRRRPLWIVSDATPRMVCDGTTRGLALILLAGLGQIG
jgi:hypothetical protein